MPCRKKKRIKRANKKNMHKHLPNELLYKICEALKLVEALTVHIGRTENVKKSCRVLNNYLEARARKMRKRMLQLLAENCWDTSNQRVLFSHNNLAVTFRPKSDDEEYIEDVERTADLHQYHGWRAPLYFGDVLARHPFPKFKCGVFYFEILVTRIMSDEGIGIGLRRKAYGKRCKPISCLLKSNGIFWISRTVAPQWTSDDDEYSSEEDEYYSGAKKRRRKHLYGSYSNDEVCEKMAHLRVKKSEEKRQQNCYSFGQGDVVGCGLEMTTRRLFFTRNGINLGSPKTDVELEGGAIFPMVRLNAKHDAVLANFGKTDFVYKFDD